MLIKKLCSRDRTRAFNVVRISILEGLKLIIKKRHYTYPNSEAISPYENATDYEETNHQIFT